MAPPRGTNVQVTSNRFPRLAADAADFFDQLVETTMTEITGDIKGRLPSKRIEVSNERTDPKASVILIGSRRRFFAGFVEYGTRNQAARPFVVPAVERARPHFEREASKLEGHWQ